jgi:hypothetical protein
MGRKRRLRLYFRPAETADNLRFHHARSNQPKLRTYASFVYQSAAPISRNLSVVPRERFFSQSDVRQGASVLRVVDNRLCQIDLILMRA